MYGLVNRAFQELVCARYGEPIWQQIRIKAGVEDEVFVRMDSYPDAVTYQLMEAASDVLQTPSDVLLEEFGRHWMRYTSLEGYGDLLADMGSNFHQALAGLDGMHARVGLLYPDLRPPLFRCTDITLDGLRLHYHSERTGFAHMVVGLVEGLGEKFGLKVGITHAVARGAVQDHDSFDIRILGPLSNAD